MKQTIPQRLPRHKTLPKHEQILRGLAGILVAFTAITLAVVLAYFVTGWVYAWLHLNPSPLVVQVVNTFLGLIFIALVITSLSFIFRAQQLRMQMSVFIALIEAVQKIAQGDYTVQIENQFEDHEPLSQLVQSVNAMAVNLNELEAMRQEFISNVSHEIQSPLTSIRGFAQALSNNHLSPEERTRYLSIIVLESTRLSKLTENLLELTSLDSEQAKFDPKPYRLDKQIQNLILSCEPQWQGKHLNLDAALDEVTINADEDLLSEVWLNLLHNSFKFTAEGGCVEVSLHRPNDLIEFQIKDTGLGISEADQARVFERFYKADAARDRSKGGSGLGLSIARKIVDLHHGTISVQSQLGIGTTFTVSLPVNSTPAVTPSDAALADPTSKPIS
jgi:two-component system, OmpR family, phosphate regulon sensor histidine kinase PhoR